MPSTGGSALGGAAKGAAAGTAFGPWGTAIGAVVGAAAGIFGAAKKNKELKRLEKMNPIYKANPLATERAALAKSLLNARMPGAAALQENIYNNQANSIGQLQRNATDSSQLLSMAAGVQAQTDQSFHQLSEEENADYQRRYGNYASATQGVIEEGDKVYQDQLRRFQDLAQMRGARATNTANALTSVSNSAYSLTNYGMSGGFNGMFKKSA